MSLKDLPATIHRLLPLRAEVDLNALRHNLRLLRAHAEPAQVMAVVKADAYGHGAVPVTRALAEEGVERFAVANVPEGIALREAGIEQPILVLAAPLPDHLPAYARYHLTATVATPEAAEAAVEVAQRVGPLTVHVKADTGMHRIGLAPEEIPEVLGRLRTAPGLEVEGLMTHCATVDHTFTCQQVARFDALVEALGEEAPPLTHVANSGTLLHVRETVEGRSLVRVGGALFGLVSGRLAQSGGLALRPVMRLVSRVVQVKPIESGASVSYGRTWRAEAPTLIATVAAGYADGVMRALSNKGEVGIGGRRYPIVGRVCMDMLMLDLGPPEGPGAAVRVGDEVVLFGPGGPTALEVARQAGTIAYAVTSGLTARVPRLYMAHDGPVPGPPVG